MVLTLAFLSSVGRERESSRVEARRGASSEMIDILGKLDALPSTSPNIDNVALFEAGDMCINVIHWSGGKRTWTLNEGGARSKDLDANKEKERWRC